GGAAELTAQSGSGHREHRSQLPAGGARPRGQRAAREGRPRLGSSAEAEARPRGGAEEPARAFPAAATDRAIGREVAACAAADRRPVQTRRLAATLAAPL